MSLENVKSPEQKKFEEFYLPYDIYSDEEIEDEEAPCDYADSECVEPSLRNMGNCFECWLYQEVLESEEVLNEGEKVQT